MNDKGISTGQILTEDGSRVNIVDLQAMEQLQEEQNEEA